MARGRAGGASNYRGFVIVKTIYQCPVHGEWKVFRDRVYDKSQKGKVNVVTTDCLECRKAK